MEFNEEEEDENNYDEYGDEIEFPKSHSMFNKENIPNLLNNMNDEDPDAFYSKADDSNAYSDDENVMMQEEGNTGSKKSNVSINSDLINKKQTHAKDVSFDYN